MTERDPAVAAIENVRSFAKLMAEKQPDQQWEVAFKQMVKRLDEALDYYRKLQEQLREAKARVRELEKAGDRLQAAVWDAYYGEGIAISYARIVDAEWRRAKGE